MIELSNIIKNYPKKEGAPVCVLDDISLSIHQGEILGIIGRSGAGKSTLVRCINMLEPPTSGTIIMDDVDLTKADSVTLRKMQQRCGMVFQHFNLLYNRTIAANVRLPLEIASIPKNAWSQRIAQALEFVGLTEYARQYPSQLSGGQKQRVGIARALALKPEILLCDEITSALDPETTDQILDLLRDINQQTGVTVVMITHEMDVVQKICHRAIVLDHGKIVEQGQTFDIFSNPQHLTTKRFIRSIFEHDIPKELALMIAQNHHKNRKFLRLIYQGDHANDPVISELVRKFDVQISVLHGRIEYIQHQPLGLLWIQCDLGENPLSDIIQFLQTATVRAEVFDHV